jgi:hypothetical protein
LGTHALGEEPHKVFGIDQHLIGTPSDTSDHIPRTIFSASKVFLFDLGKIVLWIAIQHHAIDREATPDCSFAQIPDTLKGDGNKPGLGQ